MYNGVLLHIYMYGENMSVMKIITDEREREREIASCYLYIIVITLRLLNMSLAGLNEDLLYVSLYSV